MALIFRHGTTDQTAHASASSSSLGTRRTTPRRRPAARQTSACAAPASHAHRCACAATRDDPRSPRLADIATAAIRAWVPGQPERGLRAAWLSCGALLDPARPRAPAGRSTGQHRHRVRDEKRRCAHRQTGEPVVSPLRAGAGWPPSSPAAPDTARTPACALLRAAEPSPSHGAASWQATERFRRPGPCKLRALVRRLVRRDSAT